MSNYKTYKDLPTAEAPSNSSSNLPSNLIIIESKEHKQQLINTSKVLIVDIYGDFCGPCKIIAPKYERMAKEFAKAEGGDAFVFAKEDVMKKISPYIKGVPAFEYYVDGKFYGNTVGADDVEILNKLEEIKNHIHDTRSQQKHHTGQHIHQKTKQNPNPNINQHHVQQNTNQNPHIRNIQR